MLKIVITITHDRTRAARPDELGDRRRTEYVWRIDRSETIHPEWQGYAHGTTEILPLFAELGDEPHT